MTGTAFVMMLIAALMLNALRLHRLYNLAGLTTFIGRRDWYSNEDQPSFCKRSNWSMQDYFNGLTVWSILFIPLAVRGFCHSTALHD